MIFIPESNKVAWSGRIVAIQPRIRLMRSFDQHHHGYQGHVLRLDGTCGDETANFLTAVGKMVESRLPPDTRLCRLIDCVVASENRSR